MGDPLQSTATSASSGVVGLGPASRGIQCGRAAVSGCKQTAYPPVATAVANTGYVRFM